MERSNLSKLNLYTVLPNLSEVGCITDFWDLTPGSFGSRFQTSKNSFMRVGYLGFSLPNTHPPKKQNQQFFFTHNGFCQDSFEQLVPYALSYVMLLAGDNFCVQPRVRLGASVHIFLHKFSLVLTLTLDRYQFQNDTKGIDT